MWDTHAHLLKEYYSDFDEVIKNAANNNINNIINIGVDSNTNKEIINTINNYDNVYGAIGIHPSEVNEYNENDINYIKENINHKKIVAIGEIGLDYHYTKETKEKQFILFKKLLKIAEDNNLPVVIHSREATKDTLDILKEYKVKGVIHSFSGSYETALEYIKLGYKLGISGVVTFNNCQMKDYLNKISLDNIILETDCPYLTPVPKRGKKNEPANVKYIVEFLSKIYDIPVSSIEKVTNENVIHLFDKIS